MKSVVSGWTSFSVVSNMRAVDCGHEMRARAVMERRQRQRRHDRTEIRAADADIDDVGDLFAGGAFKALPERMPSATSCPWRRARR